MLVAQHRPRALPQQELPRTSWSLQRTGERIQRRSGLSLLKFQPPRWYAANVARSPNVFLGAVGNAIIAILIAVTFLFVLPLSLFHLLPSTLWVLCRGSSNLLLFPLLGDLSFIFRNRPLLGLSHWARKLTDKRTTGQTPDVRVRGRTPLCIACEYLYYSDTHEAIPLWVFTLTVVSVAASSYHSQKSATPTTTAAAVFYHVLRPISPSMPI